MARRQARERALELLYEIEAKDRPAAEVLAELAVEPDAYALAVVQGVDEHRDQLDGVIARYARDWSLERMPVIDRSLLRMAVFELAHRPDVPTAVVIDEAVDLAKAYSTDDSGRFVNGMLSRIAEELRPPG